VDPGKDSGQSIQELTNIGLEVANLKGERHAILGRCSPLSVQRDLIEGKIRQLVFVDPANLKLKLGMMQRSAGMLADLALRTQLDEVEQQMMSLPCIALSLRMQVLQLETVNRVLQDEEARLAEIDTKLMHLTDKSKNFPSMPFNYGKRFAEQEDYEQTIRWLEMHHYDSSACSEKARVFNEQGKYDLAILCYDMALAIAPDDCALLRSKGYALCELGEWEEAILCFERAIEIDPNDNRNWGGKGWVFTRRTNKR